MSRTIEYVNSYEVSCDGYDEVQQEATHPLVYYTLKEYPDGIKAACHYCGKLYVYKDSLNNHNRINIQSLEANDLI